MARKAPRLPSCSGRRPCLPSATHGNRQAGTLAATTRNPTRCTAPALHRRKAPVERGFTLVELIVVMVLLLIVASLVAPQMSSFFRGRALSSEARRMLSLINYGQSRAVAEGVPVLLWIDPATSRYGLEIQSGHATDDRPITYTADPSLSLETPVATDAPISEDGDETLGLAENLSSLCFNPDGFFDEASVTKIIIRQGADAALEITPTANRLGYEIRPASPSN